jgi:hypothetical protein
MYHSQAGDSQELEAAAARVALVGNVVGAWQGQDQAADDRAFSQTGAVAHWTRQYVHRETKEAVLVILMCGRSGKMAVHTPEVCYGGAGYKLVDQPTVSPIRDDANFWTATFTKKASRLRLHWAWNATGAWEASTSPRWQFRGQSFLYKLYVSRDLRAQGSVAPEADATAAFLREFVPVLDQTLFPK